MKQKLLGWDDFADLGLEPGDLEGDLFHKPADGVFGMISLDQFMHDLHEHGLLERLERRGYHKFRLGLDKDDAYTERLRLFALHPDQEGELQLMDVRSHRGMIEAPWGTHYRVLGWDWVEMQDPLARPSPFRPMLPGQTHPGLGLFRGLTRLMLDYVPRLEVEGLTAVPQYFHNAVLYSGHFCFLDPQVQGRFQAACRDLLDEGLAPASWWVAREQVEMLDRGTGEVVPYIWSPEKIVRGLAPELKDRLSSSTYQEACQRVMEQVEFRLRKDPDAG
ncbi:MAG: hypothetical protein U0931_17725 [Vulcanimicrobiota bacterium]